MLEIELLEVDRNKAMNLGSCRQPPVQGICAEHKRCNSCCRQATDFANLLTLLQQVFAAQGNHVRSASDSCGRGQKHVFAEFARDIGKLLGCAFAGETGRKC